MPLTYTRTTIGTIVIKQDVGKSTIQIRTGNCLAVLINVYKITEGEDAGKLMHQLYSFFCDEQHIKNIMSNNGGKLLWDEVVSIKLNLFYKESNTLLKYFVRSGYKVTCFYKDPDAKTCKRTE